MVARAWHSTGGGRGAQLSHKRSHVFSGDARGSTGFGSGGKGGRVIGPPDPNPEPPMRTGLPLPQTLPIYRAPTNRVSSTAPRRSLSFRPGDSLERDPLPRRRSLGGEADFISQCMVWVPRKRRQFPVDFISSLLLVEKKSSDIHEQAFENLSPQVIEA